MLVKLAFPILPASYIDIDMLRCKEVNNFATECVLPRRLKRSLPPLPEDKECSSLELKKCIILHKKKYRIQCLLLPALKEYDEC